MASGDLSLVVTDRVGWALFGPYARAILWALGGRVVSRADTPVERVWQVNVDGRDYWLCFNDWGLGVSLDSQDGAASDYITQIKRRLLAVRDGVRGAA